MLLPAIVLVLVTKGGAGRVTRGTPALQGEIATQLVITDTGATAICDLKVGIAGSQISKTSVRYLKLTLIFDLHICQSLTGKLFLSKRSWNESLFWLEN